MRITWFVVVVTVLAMFVASVPPHLKRLTTVYPTSQRTFYLLSTSEAAALDSLGISQETYAVVLDASVLLMLFAFVGFGMLIFLRKSDNWMAILFSFALITLGVTYNTSIESLTIPYPQLAPLVVLVQQIAYTSVLATMFLFPDGHLVARWNLIPLVSWVCISIVALGLSFRGYETGATTSVAILLIIWLVAGIIAQVYRYFRKSNAFERQQTRWLLFGISIAVLGFAVYIMLPLLFHSTLSAGVPRVLFNMIGVPLFIAFPALLVPITFGIAVLRHRLWDIDFIINRTLVYLALTGALAVVYFAGVYGLQQVFVLLTGTQQSNIAIAASTVVIVGLFQPLRVRLQRWVDRRFRVRTPSKRGNSSTQVDDVLYESGNEGRWSGSRLGAYQLYELAGQGGMAEVYRGQHIGLNRTAAVKVMAGQMAHDLEFQRRFEREAQVVATLHHPNIVQVYDFGDNDGTYYMAMAYVNGQTLAHYLKEKGKLTFEEALPILREIASALDYAHDHDIIHRDVKPSNIIFQTDETGTLPGHAILTDFGLAKMMSNSSMNTMSGGGILGTLNYLAPEQIDSSRQVGPAADTYALGIVAYQMLTGTVPFSGDNPGAILVGHLQRPAPDPRQLTASIPRRAAMAIVNALAKEPDERYPSATEFIKAMETP